MSEEWIVKSVVRITDESRLIEAAQKITDEVTDLTGALAALTAPDRTGCGYEVTYHQVRPPEPEPPLKWKSLNWDNILEGCLIAFGENKLGMSAALAFGEYRDGFAR